ncbi:unnamed protein product [Trifolium pratense]|uniref:Uncharacterized protein n=1 Tax=Trifolium pratense TaxID=57577 RepID=A0ACB0J609_TRIPR|nr:unnamed protein product [Trifolium pratense]
MAFSATSSSEGGNPSCGPITFKLRTSLLEESPQKSLKLEITPSIPEADANGLLDRLHAQLSSEGKELLLHLKESDDAFHFEIDPVLKDNTKSVKSKPFHHATSRFETEFNDCELIGEGGFGRVYKGKHVIDGALYAVKKIRIKGVEDKQLREVHTLSVVNHKHVVRYYQSWLQNGPLDPDLSSEAGSASGDQSSKDVDIKEWLYLYIQMERCSRTLRELLEDSPPPPTETRLKLFRQILKGLVCIHEKNIIHRDLNPNNIFLDGNGDIKIGDFGLGESKSFFLFIFSKEIIIICFAEVTRYITVLESSFGKCCYNVQIRN